MAIRELSGLGVVACALIMAGAAHAESGSYRIRHAESIGVTAADMRADSTLSFVAYGRQFDLELEPNARLLNALDSSQRRAFAQYAVYRGRLRGVPGSWIRIVRAGTALSGAIWDGNDLYSIAPGQALNTFVDQPLQTPAGTLAIYRLSDTVGDVGGASCIVARRSGTAEKSAGALADYKGLIGELRANAAELADRQIEIAFVGDGEFSDRHAADPQAAALTRINIVDGILSEQVGVIIAAPVIRVFPSLASDPFSAIEPLAVLGELSGYRAATPDVRDRGLAHLFTGKNLEDNVLGVAFLGSLCEVEAGVGVTESWHPDLMSALITAHEIGHNFNAPHDGEAGSPCINVSQSLLMSPFFNFTPQFSQCSLNEMYVAMETAACIVAGNAPDAQMGTEGLIAAAPGQPFDVPFDVASVGTADIASARVTVQLPVDLTFISASVAGGGCAANSGVVTCELGAMPAGTSRPGNLRFLAQSTGRREIVMRVTATGDRREENDTDAVVVDIGAGADLTVGVSPSTILTLTDQSFSFVVTLASVGTSPVNDAAVVLPINALTIEDVQAPGATCSGTAAIVCTYGTLAAGEARQVVVRARSALARDFQHTVRAQSSNDGNTANDSRSVRLVVSAAADATIEPSFERRDRAIGETFDLVFTVASTGRQPVNNVVARMPIPTGFVVESATGGGSACTVNATEVQCPLGTMASRTSRRMIVRGRGVAETLGFSARVTASNDGNPANDQTLISISIRPAVDVALDVISPPVTTFEGRSFEMRAVVSSRGVNTARDVTTTAALPPSFELLQVTTSSGSGTCQAVATTATCTFASLPSGTGTQMVVEARANLAGVHTVNFAVAATGDDTSANNTRVVQIFVGEDVDVSLTGPASLVGGVVQQPIDIPFTVRTGARAVNHVTLTLFGTSAMQLESINPQIVCTLSAGGTLVCPLGDLAARTTMVLTPRLRFVSPTHHDVLVRMSASGDTNSSNDTASFRLEVDEPADLALSVARPSLTAVTGTDFLAEVQLAAPGSNDGRNVRVQVTLPNAITIASVNQAGCSFQAGVVDCAIGTVAPGTSRNLGFNLRTTTAGTYTLDLRVAATNDINAQNDRGQITVVVAAAAVTPPAPAPGGGGGGGGGGGSSNGLLILVLALTALVRALAVMRAPRESRA